jgi:hypothetical protein
MDDAITIDGGDPVDILGDIDADADAHSPLRVLTKIRRPAHAVIALHSDQSQSLISGRGGVTPPGDLPPEPSMAASMKTIPAAPPGETPAIAAANRKALFTQHLKGRAA